MATHAHSTPASRVPSAAPICIITCGDHIPEQALPQTFQQAIEKIEGGDFYGTGRDIEVIELATGCVRTAEAAAIIARRTFIDRHTHAILLPFLDWNGADYFQELEPDFAEGPEAWAA